MKRVKLTVLFICMTVLFVSVLSGCGQNVAKSADEKMSWTATKWESASADEKKACALAYTEYVAKETGITNVKEQIENMGDDELNAVVAVLDTLFKSSGEQSLQEVMDVMFKKPS